MSTATVETRDLDADLTICEAATQEFSDSECEACGGTGYVEICHDPYGTVSCFDCFVTDVEHSKEFLTEARQGWPYAIRRAQESERENDRLRDEINMLQEQLNQNHRSHCYD